MEILKAKVEKLLLTHPFDQPPTKHEKVELVLEGLKFDKHFGKTRCADVRTVKLLPKGIEVTNLRSVTIVSAEELDEISTALGFEVLPEDLEANITLSGVKNLTKLPPGTYLKFPNQAILFITSENLPCSYPAENMIKRGMDKNAALNFPKVAMGKRGITAMPFASGFIKTGDMVEIYPPQKLE